MTQKQAAGYMRYVERSAFVSPTFGNATMIFDEEADSQEQTPIEKLSEDISKAFSTSVFAALGHDNDLFLYWLFKKGDLIDTYNSWPEWPSPKKTRPSGGDAKLLCAAFGIPDSTDDVDNILCSIDYKDACQGAEQRHRDLAELLHIPLEYANEGYRSLVSNSKFPDHEGLTQKMIRLE